MRSLGIPISGLSILVDRGFRRCWKPSSTWITINLALLTRGGQSHGGVLFRDSKGDFIMAKIRVVDASGQLRDLADLIRFALMESRESDMNIAAIQSSHPKIVIFQSDREEEIPGDVLSERRQVLHNGQGVRLSRIFCPRDNIAAISLVCTMEEGTFTHWFTLHQVVQKSVRVDRAVLDHQCHGCYKPTSIRVRDDVDTSGSDVYPSDFRDDSHV
ncbi:hypothetical protein QQ045_018612 [Rhodiola kirilowii]